MMSTRPYTYYPPPPDQYYIQARLRNKPPPHPPSPVIESRFRAVTLADKQRRSAFVTAQYRNSSYYPSEVAALSVSSGGGGLPRMGVKAPKKTPNRASAIYTSEQSLPDKLTAALKSLRPSGLSHSTSGSTPFKGKQANGVVAADDVVFIPSTDSKPQILHRFSPNQKLQRKARSIFLRNSPSQSDLSRLAEQEDPPLKDLEQIRALYRSVPNVSCEPEEAPARNDRGRRHSQRFEDDAQTELSSSTRSPTDSGYRSASRHIGEHPYTVDDTGSSASDSLGGSHKSTTVVLLNEDAAPRSPSISRGHQVRLRCNIRRPTEEGPMDGRCPTLPFSARDVVAVLQSPRCRPYSNHLDASTLQRFVSLLEAPLVMLTDEMDRLCTYALKLTVEEVVTAIKVTFPLEVFSSCIKAGMQATTLYALSGTGALRKSMSQRAELNFSVGRVYRWLTDRVPNKPISDTVAVFLAATLECVLEELILRLADSDSKRILTARDIDERMHGHPNLSHFFLSIDTLSRKKCSPMIGFPELIDVVHEIRDKITLECDGSLSVKNGKRAQIKLSRGGIRALHYYITSSGAYKPIDAVPIADWVRIAYAYAEHRMSYTVDESDIQQAARALIHTYCPPVSVQFWRHDLYSEVTVGEARKAFAFQLISTASPENIREAADMLEPDKLAARNVFGLCPLSEAIVQAKADAVTALLSSNCPVNCTVPSPSTDRRPYLLKEYTGWTPLTWAVAIQKYNLVQILLNAKADVESEQMIKESPLQVAVQLPHADCVRSLLEKGADPFKSSIVYDSLHAHFRNSGCASAVALAAARGNDHLMRMFMQRVAQQKTKSVSVSDFLNGGGKSRETADSSRTDHDTLAKETRLALQEAMYYAAETCRPGIAVDIKDSVAGVNWNIYIWTKALEAALEHRSTHLIERILSDFGAKLAAELTHDTIAECLHVLFGIIRWSCSIEGGDPSSAAATISRVHHYLKDAPEEKVAPPLSPCHRPLIDSTYINNPQFSDVKFMVGDHAVYGHRIVLINASDRFRCMLQCPPGEVIPIDDVSYHVFLALLEFVYTGQLSEGTDLRSLLPLLPAARSYGLPSLHSEAIRLLSSRIDHANFIDLYSFAIDHSIGELMSKCERYLLENLPLLVAEAPVRRLLVRRKEPGAYHVSSALTKRLISMFDASRPRKNL